ncbi:MAG: T9SS type A sorting domain-containing protein [Ignavibacteria bacterium]|nr:T9SS type A sorting domain-containing protein [Ignavibacteria bacterium]
MKNFILILSLFTLVLLCEESNAQPYYYNSGIPSLVANWGNQPGGTGTPPSSFGENTEYIIESGKTAIVDFNWFIDNNATLRVNTSGTLQINYAVNIGANATLRLDSNGTCIYNSTYLAETTVFGGTENFHSYSNFIIRNWSGLNDPLISNALNASGPISNNYFFGNLEIDWQSQTGNWSFNRNVFPFPVSNVANDWKITSTGIGKLLTVSPNSPGAGSYFITKNYIQTGGEIDLAFGAPNFIVNFASLLGVSGNFKKTGGILDANSTTSFGIIRIDYQKSADYSTFENVGTFRNTGISLNSCKLKLLSDLPVFSSNPYCTFLASGAIIDCNNYKVTGNTFLQLHSTIVKVRSPEGFKNGASGGDFTIAGKKELANTIFEFCGASAQITGDSLPSTLKGLEPYEYQNIIINNPNGVTLSKDTRMAPESSFRFVQGKLNLANYNFKIAIQDSIHGVNENCFFNTNGTGVLRIGLDQGYTAKFPVGNGTFSPFYITQAYTGNTDTIGIRVENSFGSHAPFDTSRCVRKLWRVFDENPGNPTSFRAYAQFMKNDIGVNMDLNSTFAVGQYEAGGYNGYRPSIVHIVENFYTPPDSSVSKALSGGLSYVTSGDDYYVFGNEDGVFETYYPDNTGNASILGNWTSLNGLHPPSFDRYAIFSVPSGRTASFDNSATLTDKAWLRSSGSGIINANAPLFVNGILELKDSSVYNHNNTIAPGQSSFGGREFFSSKSTFKILKWSDTTDKAFDNLESGYGNLVINFNNLPAPFGSNNYWTVFKNDALPYRTEYTVRGNLTYLQSSGYQFAPIGFGSVLTKFIVTGNVQIGDSLNNTAFPIMNLSGGTTRTADTTAGTLEINGNLDIQNGGLTSQDFPAVARGRIVFARETMNVPKSHTFYCFNPFLWQTSNLGNNAFPNRIESDTLTLKSDMYRSGNPAFLFTDAWQVESGAALNTDVYRIRSLNLKIKNGGKLITKNPEGFYADLANQNVTFESNASLEFAGSTPQNLEKAGAYNLASIPNLIINNPNDVTVNVPDVSITGSITFISGKLISSNLNYLSVNENVQFYGVNTNSFINGPLKVNTSSMNTVTIPLGKGSNQRNLVITPANSNSTDWTVEYFNQQQAFGNTLGAGITSISNNEYFLINRSGASPSNAVIGLSWGANSGVTNPANLRVARWNDFQWEDKGNSNYSGDATGGIVYSNMITQFSPFVIASTDGQQLPVELASFSASVNGNNVNLKWKTETEQNNSGFEIERKSTQDTNWSKVNFIAGTGSSSSPKQYEYEDRNLTAGTFNYRLKQIDYNGNYHYYNLQSNVTVGIPAKFELSQNYPNPFNPTTKINFSLPVDANVTIKVYDMTGKEMAVLINNEAKKAGYFTVDFNAAGLSSGTYFYRITAKDFTQTKKMTLIK